MQVVSTSVNNLTSQGNGILLRIFIIIQTRKFTLSQGANIDSDAHSTTGERQADLLTFLEKVAPMKPCLHMKLNNLMLSPIADYLDSISDNMKEAWALIPLWKQMRIEEPSTCQLTSIEIETLENAISTLTHALFSLNGVCELPSFPSSNEVISRYHNSQPWSTGDGVSERHKFLEEMMQGITVL